MSPSSHPVASTSTERWPSWPGLLERADVGALGRMFAVDANAYFSRPGPRVVDGVELLEGLLHEGAAPPVRSGARLLRRG